MGLAGQERELHLVLVADHLGSASTMLSMTPQLAADSEALRAQSITPALSAGFE